MPHGPDEHAYIGAANRMVLFENKTLTVFFPKADNLLPYILGWVAKIGHIETLIVFRIAQILLNAAIVILWFRVGLLFSRGAAALFAFFSAVTISTSFWLGPAYMVPSSLMYIAIPLLCLFVLKRRWWALGGAVFAIGMLYWWALGPIGLTLAWYFFLSRRRGLVVYAIAMAVFVILARVVFKDAVITLISGVDYPAWYLERVFAVVALFAGCVVPGLVAIGNKKYHKYRTLWILAISLISTNIAFGLAFGSQLQARTFYFLYFGMVLLLAITWEVLRSESVRWRAVVPMVTMAALLLTICFQSVTRDVFKEQQLTATEWQALVWIRENLPAHSVVLSDYGTMLLNAYHVNNKDHRLIEDPAVEDVPRKTIELVQAGHVDVNGAALLKEISSSLGVKSIYLMISPRTCFSVEYYATTRQVWFTRELPFYYTRCQVVDPASFKATSIYSDKETYIYQLLSESDRTR